MGIENLYDVIKKHAPNAASQKIKLSRLCGHKIAIDISVFLYKFIRSAGEIRWINTFILFLCSLKKSGIKPICIFDGPNFPPEKKERQQERRDAQKKIIDRLSECKRWYTEIKKKHLPSMKPLSKSQKEQIQKTLKIRDYQDGTDYDDPRQVLATLKQKIEKDEKATIQISAQFNVVAKDLIEIMGFPWYQADGEAEHLCTDLAFYRKVDAVMTEDTDVLARGAPVMISKFETMKDGDAEVSWLVLEDILNEMGLHYEEFRDLCILLGCDYNDRIKIVSKTKKLVNVGPVKAFDLIYEHGSIDEIRDMIHDIAPLKYERCRELFTVSKEVEEMEIPYNEPIDLERMEEFLKTHKSNIHLDYISECWKPIQVIFEIPKTKEEEETFTDEFTN